MRSILGIKNKTSMKIGITIFFVLLGFLKLAPPSLGGADAPSDQILMLDALKSPINYSNWNATEKRTWIWNHAILTTAYPHDKLPPFEDIDILGLIRGSMNTKMDHLDDIAPENWKKPIHRRAVVAQVRWVPSPHAQKRSWGSLSQEQLGLLRASLTYTPKKRGLAPGLALKIFRDQKPSLDVSLLTGLDSHGQNYNFFEKPFSNFVPPSKSFGARIVDLIFSRASRPTQMIGFQHFSADDRKVSGSGPIQIFFKSSLRFSPEAHDIRNDFMGLPIGTELGAFFYRSAELESDYLAYDSPKSKLFSQSANTCIGSLVLESVFVASEFGDDRLFFRHERYQPGVASKK